MPDHTFLDLQNGFYNAISQGLGFAPRSPFQLIQPSPPLVSTTNQDNTLWEYFNNIPPASLSQNYIASGGSQFFSNYKGLLSALDAPRGAFEQTVGPNVYSAWLSYVRSASHRPAMNQQPQLFLNWASLQYPDIADAGASQLSQMQLDPIASAQMEILSVYPSPTPPDWSHNYADLVQQLASAPSRTFQVSSSSMNCDVSQSWTQGEHSGIFGLWSGSSSESDYSAQFADSDIEVNATFDHATTFHAAPGPWYSSAAMGNAYANQASPPWKPNWTINWRNTFDAHEGNIARLTVNLIVVSEMSVRVTSSAKFSTDQQNRIKQNSGAGVWPIYTSSSHSGASTTVEFNNAGNMTVQIASEPNIPIVIGCSVLPVELFVGHAMPVGAPSEAREMARDAG